MHCDYKELFDRRFIKQIHVLCSELWFNLNLFGVIVFSTAMFMYTSALQPFCIDAEPLTYYCACRRTPTNKLELLTPT